jgi:polysaccharide biosynthesis protein PslH
VRILFLCNTPPLSPTSGAVIQTYHFMRLLAEKNHEVGLWAISPQEHARSEFGALGEKLAYQRSVSMPKERRFGRRWAWLSGKNPMARWGYHGPELEESLCAAVADFQPDIVQCEQLHVAHFFLGLANKQPHPLLVFNAHDAIHVVLARSRAKSASGPRQLLDSWFVEAVRRMEAGVVRKADLTCCVSDTDAEALHLRREAKRFAVTPNGVDIDYFSALPDAPATDAPVLAFTGSMNYAPNADAIEYYAQDMHQPLRREFPSLKLNVIGSVTDRLRKYGSIPGLEFVGFQSDTRPYFREAQISIVPLRAGSGTRFKILESWAMGRAVVSTTIGAEGLPYRDGENLLIADSAGDFCSKVAILLRDAELRKRLAVAGRNVVEQHFSWQKIVTDLDRHLTALCHQRQSSVA